MKRKITVITALLFSYLLNAQVQQAEYFFDTDPGYGKGIQIAPASSVEETADKVLEAVSFNAPVSELEDGCHTLYVRARGANGWSQTQSRPFIKMALSNETACEVQYAEYFFDTDPGYGKGEAVALPESGNAYAFDVDIKGMADGLHTLYARALNKDSRWSQTMSRPFVKTILPTDLASGLTAVEYYLDVAPGVGSATVAPFSADVNQLDFLVDLTGISEGNHTLVVRGKNRIEQWELIGEHLFTVIEESAIQQIGDDGISAYPNPVHDILFIKNDNLNIKSIELTDLNGKSSFSYPVGSSMPVVRIDLSGYPAGYYLLKITTDKGSVKTLKIIRK